MKSKLSVSVLVVVFIILAAVPASSAPLAGPCAPGAAYDPACDVNRDGTVNVLDVQLTAGHWNQNGPWTGDNSHNHLGQTWTGVDNPLKIEGTFVGADNATLVLSNSAPSGDGLRVTLANGDGLFVDSAGKHGLRVDSAGFDGVYVQSASTTGVRVYSAGVPSAFSFTSANNGFEVNGAEGYGLYVGRADNDGVQVDSAGGDGVDAVTNTAANFGGNFRNTAAGGAGVRAFGGDNAAPDLVLGGTAAGDDGRIYSEQSLIDSDLLLYTNDEAHVHLDEDNNSTSTFTVYNGTNASVWSVNETGTAVAAGASAVQVNAGRQGPRLTYAVTSPQNWIEDFGSGQLQDGQAVIALEPVYGESVSAGQPYHVFLTPLGDCALFVAEKTTTSFTVRAIDGKLCTITFDYRIVALRRGYETVRLEQFAGTSDE